MELENLTSVKPAPDYEYFFNVCVIPAPLSCIDEQATGKGCLFPIDIADSAGDVHVVPRGAPEDRLVQPAGGARAQRFPRKCQLCLALWKLQGELETVLTS